MLGCVECAFILAVWRFDSVSLCCVIEGLGGLRCKAWAFLGGQGDQADLCLRNLRCLWVVQGVPIKMRHLFSFISPYILMLQFYALYGQWKDVLMFVLHIGTGLRDKWFQRYSVSGFVYQILCQTILKVQIYWRIYRYMRF
jgi:hypothetical protein